jgi:DHA1 family tetracycline resistance protein-like MFS transporter
MQLDPNMSPTWYYAAGSCTGLVNWIAVALSSLSDVMPPKWRAPSFGLLLAGFSLGFAMAPLLALMFDHFQVSLFSFTLILSGFILTALFFPETLPPEVAEEAASIRAEQDPSTNLWEKTKWTTMRPFRELSILNRNRLFRLLSTLAFFSGMVTSADQTLLLYYVEERLSFKDHDVALMFMIIGMLGIFIQGVLLKPINDCIGERFVIVLAFMFGSLDNVMYGLARKKATIFVAVSISTFTGMSFPTISAIKANNVVCICKAKFRVSLSFSEVWKSNLYRLLGGE